MAEIPEAMVEKALDAIWGDPSWRESSVSSVHRNNMRAALEAIGVGEMVEALEAAEELYKIGLFDAPDGMIQRVQELRANALSRLRTGEEADE